MSVSVLSERSDSFHRDHDHAVEANVEGNPPCGIHDFSDSNMPVSQLRVPVNLYHEYSHDFHSHKGDDIFLTLLENRKAHWDIGQSTKTLHLSHFHIGVDADSGDHDNLEGTNTFNERSGVIREHSSNCCDDLSSISSDGHGPGNSDGNKVEYMKRTISRDTISQSSAGSGKIVISRQGRFIDMDKDLKVNAPSNLSACEEGLTPPSTPPRDKDRSDSSEGLSPVTSTSSSKKKKLFSLKKMVPKFLRRRGYSFNLPSESVMSVTVTDAEVDTSASTATACDPNPNSESRRRFLRRPTL